MQNNPKISVIVPIYNAEKYIDRCMKSIYAQTFKDYEIILVNDGSKDRSAEICQRYCAADPRIIFIDKENGGAGSARNAGIEIANGEYLAFPDVDDWFEPTMYEELIAMTQNVKYDIVFSGANYYQQTKEGTIEYSRTVNCESVIFDTKKKCREEVMTFFPTSTIFDVPWNKLYKRSVAIENGVRFSDTRRCQDAMFNLDFYDAVESAVSVNKAFYNYIENTQAGVQRKFPLNYIDINVAYFQKLINMLTSWEIYKGDIKQHYETSFVLAVFETMCMFDNPVWNLSAKEKVAYIKDIMSMDAVQELIQKACVREEAVKMYEIIKNQDYYRFMLYYRIERIKESLRKNSSLVALYRKIRKK